MTASTTVVKCPHCRKTLGNFLKGVYSTTCPGCKQVIYLDSDMLQPIDIPSKSVQDVA